MSLNDVTAERFKDEIVKGDVVVRWLTGHDGEGDLYFRHPFTQTGDTAEKKSEIDQFLLDRGYNIVPHTVDSQDYIFNVLYRDSVERADNVLRDRICSSYVDFVIRATGFAERTGEKLFGRAIPQIIIHHANDINAGCLDALLAELVEEGYSFISLDSAMEDPAYRTPDTLVTRAGPSWLWRWTRSMGKEVSFKDDPEPPAWVLSSFRQLAQ